MNTLSLTEALVEFLSVFPEETKPGKPTRREQAIAINKLREIIKDEDINALLSMNNNTSGTRRKRRTKEEIKNDKIAKLNDQLLKLETKLSEAKEKSTTLNDQLLKLETKLSVPKEKTTTLNVGSSEFIAMEYIIQRFPKDIENIKRQIEQVSNEG